jgi:hypothetical protein
MPRKNGSPRTKQRGPAGPEHTRPERTDAEHMVPRHTEPLHPAETAPDAWLENPRNIQAFYEAIERARKAKGRDRAS